MTLNKQYLTKNECYIVGNRQNIRGIMVHSTGCNNTSVSSYLNYWNQLRPDGRQVCVHAFIGRLPDGSVGTYQTLPWDMGGWHSGQGTAGSANFMGYIGFEICEDDLTDKVYFEKVYREAVELCVYLCQLHGLTEQDIICHSEGYTMGIASNHADVMHWFPKFGKSMDTFRSDVKSKLTSLTCDNTPADWSKDAVNWAIENDLLRGSDNGDFMLRSPITREQFCVLLKRYHDLAETE